jgi:hypothetical protein
MSDRPHSRPWLQISQLASCAIQSFLEKQRFAITKKIARVSVAADLKAREIKYAFLSAI